MIRIYTDIVHKSGFFSNVYNTTIGIDPVERNWKYKGVAEYFNEVPFWNVFGQKLHIDRHSAK